MQWDELYSTLKHDRFRHMNKKARNEFIEKIRFMDPKQMEEALVTYFQTIENE